MKNHIVALVLFISLISPSFTQARILYDFDFVKPANNHLVTLSTRYQGRVIPFVQLPEIQISAVAITKHTIVETRK